MHTLVGGTEEKVLKPGMELRPVCTGERNDYCRFLTDIRAI